MSALDGLVAGEEALVAALDGQDIAAIESATAALAAALAGLAAAGRSRIAAEPEVATRLGRALRLAEAAGGRINYLADRNRRQLDRLATLTGAPLPVAYRRAGRYG